MIYMTGMLEISQRTYWAHGLSPHPSTLYVVPWSENFWLYYIMFRVLSLGVSVAIGLTVPVYQLQASS